ncbi:MAG TPA: hypothetical protein VIG33_00895 [Pseudobdellovibrionaceae bacterium]
MNKNDSIDNTMLRVITAFGDSDQYCGDILKNVRLVATEPQGSAVDSIDFHNQNHSVLQNAAKIGALVEGKRDLVLSDIRLKPVTALSADIIVASLELTFKKSNVLGPPFIMRWLPIYATVKNNVVDTCSTSNNSAVALKIRLCEIANDGFNHYDVATDSCILNQDVKWTNGVTSFEAACESGWTPAVSQVNGAPELTVCRAETPPFVSLAPRAYLRTGVESGATSSWFAAMDAARTKCIFTYVAGINSSLHPPKIKCARSVL